MGKTSLITHVVMVVIAVSIGFLYIQPTIESIKANQVTASVFKGELDKVNGVNALLDERFTSVGNIASQSKQRLTTFMPDSIDKIAVMRTLEAILLLNEITPATLAFEDGDQNRNTQTRSSVQSTTLTDTALINTSFVTDEETLYKFFQTVQNSSYPFVLSSLSITPAEGFLLTVDAAYTVSALKPTQLDLTGDGSLVDGEEEF